MSAVTDRPTDTTSSVSGGAPSGGTGGSRVLRRVLFWVMIAVLTITFLAPLLWMLVTSFKNKDAATSSYSWIPNPFDTSAYKTLFGSGSQPVLRWFLNSLIAGLAN